MGVITNGQRDILFVFGMSLYWPFFSFAAFPGMFGDQSTLFLQGLEPSQIIVQMACFVFAALSALRHQKGRVSTLSVQGNPAPFGIASLLACSSLIVIAGAIGVSLAHQNEAVIVLGYGVMIASGANLGWLTIAWGQASRRVSGNNLQLLLALSLFLSFALRHLLEGACYLAGAPMAAPGMISLMPLTSCFLWIAFERQGPANGQPGFPNSPQENRAAREERLVHNARGEQGSFILTFRSPYAKMALALGLYLVASFFFGNVNDGSSLRATTPLSKAVALVFAAAIVVLAWASTQREHGLSYSWVLFVGACIVVSYFVSSFGSSLPQLAREVVLPTRVCSILFAWLAACCYAREEGVDHAMAIAVLFCPIVLVEFLLPIIASVFALPAFGSDASPLIVFLCVLPSVLLLIAALIDLVRVAGRTSANAGGAASAGAVGASNPEARRDRICSELAQQYDLTLREQEVLMLLSEGNSMKKIAEILFIAPSSSQTYSKSVYRKLGVHSRQEIIDLVAQRIKAGETMQL